MHISRETSEEVSWEESVPPSDARNLLGVMRTGLFACGLMLAGESNVQLVLLTVTKPTITLLHRIANRLAEELPVCSLFLLPVLFVYWAKSL